MCDWLRKLPFYLNSFFCHQIPSRSLFIAGLQLPLCSRCTAINLGLFLGYIWIFYRYKTRRFYYNIFATLAFLTPIVVDGLTQFLGFRESTNDIRIITGALAGIAAANALGYILLELKEVNYERTGARGYLAVHLLGTVIVFVFLKLAEKSNSILMYYSLSIFLTLLVYLNNVFIPLYVIYLLTKRFVKR